MIEVEEAVTAVERVGDILSLGVVVATLAQWLPSVAAGLSIVWTVIRIFETKTVQGLLGRNELNSP